MHAQSPTAPSSLPGRNNHWSRRKKIAAFLAVLMVLTPFVAASLYMWDITRAIEGVQDQAVVDFPTSKMELGGVSHMGTPAQNPIASPQSHDQITANGEPNVQPTVTSVADVPAPTSRSNPSTFNIAKDLIGTGTRADVVMPEDVWSDQTQINILVLGVDTREAEGDQNADVIMIARLDFVTNEMRVVSIPRDLQVEVPGFGPSKINGAYNIGIKNDPDNNIAGVMKMRDTIEYNFSVRIDEFVLVDFRGFEKVIDAVGGITIDVPERIEDDTYPTEDFGTTTLVIEEGRQQMDGETALAYSRTRHQDSDDQRRERQMLVLRALLNEGQSLGSVTRISQVITATGDAVLTSIDWEEQLALMGMALKLDQNDIVMENITEPLVTPGTSKTGGWIYVGDPAEIGAYIEAVLSGESAGD